MMFPANMIGPRGTPFIFFDGNSLTQQVADNGYVPKTIELLGERKFQFYRRPVFSYSGWPYTNTALGGQQTAAMITRAATVIDPFYFYQRYMNVYVPWELLNSFINGGLSAATIYNQYVTLCEGRKALGFIVIAVTALPANAATYPTWEAARQTINQNIRDNYRDFAHALADVGDDPTIGQAGDTTNATYYQVDGVHLKVPGGTIVAEHVSDAILSIS